jgi:hypothetical protein
MFDTPGKIKFQPLIVSLLAASLVACVTGMPMEPVAQLIQCHEVPHSHDAIIGGKEVGYGDPDQKIVTLLKIRRDDHESVCTGTLISDRVILTAAHCIEGVEPKNIAPQFITTKGCPINQVRESSVDVIKTVAHKNFDGSPQSLSDLALLYLDDDAPSEQQRIPILNSIDKPTSDRILLIGFGITGETKKDSQVLRRIYKSLREDITYRDRSLIVNQSNASGGFCRGDSGAPIIAEVWGEPHIIGVNSANIGLKPNTECQTLSLAIDVLPFSKWILGNKHYLESSNWISRFLSESAEKTN